MGDNAGRLAVIEKQTPAGARAEELSFGQMLKRAEVLAKTELVPKALQGKPEAIVLVGAKGAELGVPFIASLTDIHVIEGSASPSAQLRLALLRRAGHEARFVESDEEKAVIRGRRREYRDDPNAWVTVTWTIEQARKAGLLDVTHERWVAGENGRRRPMRWVEGSTPEPPEWITKPDVEIKRRENWWRYPAEMLRARAASALCRMEFSDVLSGLGVDPFTIEEHGLDAGQDVDEPVLMDEDQDGDIVDGEIVEQGEDPGPIGHATVAPPGPGTEADDEELAAYIRWKRAGKPRDENGFIVDVPPATEEPERGQDNAVAEVVEPQTAPAPSGPVPGEWRARAAEQGRSDALLLKKAREFAAERGVEGTALPLTLDQVTDPADIARLEDWIG